MIMEEHISTDCEIKNQTKFDYDFSTLPAHVLTIIISRLAISDLKNASETCKSWYYATHNPTISEHIGLYFSMEPPCIQSGSGMDIFVRPVTRIRFEYINFNKFDYKKLLKNLGNTITEVQIISCGRLRITQLFEMFIHLPSLKKLRLDYGARYFKPNNFYKHRRITKHQTIIMANLARVQELYITTMEKNLKGAEIILSYCTNLKTLHWNENLMREYPDDFLHDILLHRDVRCMPVSLENLMVHTIDPHNNSKFFEQLVNLNLTKLRSLDLREISASYYDAKFNEFCKTYSKLEKLKLFGCNDQQLEGICRFMGDLKTIILDGVTATNLNPLGDLNKLESLTLHRQFRSSVVEFPRLKLKLLTDLTVDCINTIGLKVLCKNLPQLKCLRIDYVETIKCEPIFIHLIKLEQLHLRCLVTSTRINSKLIESDPEWNVTKLVELKYLYVSTFLPGFTRDLTAQLPHLTTIYHDDIYYPPELQVAEVENNVPELNGNASFCQFAEEDFVEEKNRVFDLSEFDIVTEWFSVRYDFSTLPSHVLAKILSHLKIADFRSASQTCKSMYYASCDPRISKQIGLNFTAQPVDGVGMFVRPVTKIRFREINFISFDYKHLLRNFGHIITELHIDSCTYLQITQLIEMFIYLPNLKVLRLENGSRYFKPNQNYYKHRRITNQTNTIKENLGRVEELHITTTESNLKGAEIILSYCTNLKVLNWFESSNLPMPDDFLFDVLLNKNFGCRSDCLEKLSVVTIDPSCNSKFFEHMINLNRRNLRSLELKEISHTYYDFMFKEFCRTYSKLERLKMFGCNDQQLVDICKYMSNLKKLEVSCGTAINFKVLGNLKYLESLLLYQEIGINNDSLIEYFRLNPKCLTEIELDGNITVDSGFLKALCENLPQLKSLQLEYVSTTECEPIFIHLTRLERLHLYFIESPEVNSKLIENHAEWNATKLVELKYLYLNTFLPGFTPDLIAQLPKLETKFHENIYDHPIQVDTGGIEQDFEELTSGDITIENYEELVDNVIEPIVEPFVEPAKKQCSIFSECIRYFRNFWTFQLGIRNNLISLIVRNFIWVRNKITQRERKPVENIAAAEESQDDDETEDDSAANDTEDESVDNETEGDSAANEAEDESADNEADEEFDDDYNRAYNDDVNEAFDAEYTPTDFSFFSEWFCDSDTNATEPVM